MVKTEYCRCESNLFHASSYSNLYLEMKVISFVFVLCMPKKVAL